MKDGKFRDSLPPELENDVRKYILNPNCPCNLDVYRNILKYGRKQLLEYYPNKEIVNVDEDLPILQENSWTVINCGINEIEAKLKQYAAGRIQVAIARWQDQATIIINNLDT